MSDEPERLTRRELIQRCAELINWIQEGGE